MEPSFPLIFHPFHHTPNINKIPAVLQSIYFLLQAQVLNLEMIPGKKRFHLMRGVGKGKLQLKLHQLIFRYNEINSI